MKVYLLIRIWGSEAIGSFESVLDVYADRDKAEAERQRLEEEEALAGEEYHVFEYEVL